MSTSDVTPNLDRIADRLLTVAGVIGIVLGGSRARGTNNPDSDYDVGVYYENDAALDLEGLARAAAELDDEHRANLIAPPGAWGNWVNGGGWLAVDGTPVDLILRDIGRVELAVSECLEGKVHAHYQTGHPHAYLNAMYAGELAVARILRDPAGRLRALREKALPYPEKLKQAVIAFFGFEAGFSLMLAKAQAKRDDGYYVAAHILRSLSCLNQALFAVNGEYCLNEKKAVGMIDGFPLRPKAYKRRVDEVIRHLGGDAESACRELESLVEEARGWFGAAR